VVSDTDSVVGIHYYFHLPTGHGKVISQIKKHYMADKVRKEIPSDWNIDSQQKLTFDLSQPADYTFYPFPNPLEGKIELDAETYHLEVSYKCKSQENSWQLYHPAGASFVCIEPLSAQDPRHPNLTVSSIQIHLEIKDKSG
jgi:galactose mutarotase-like enzyme